MSIINQGSYRNISDTQLRAVYILQKAALECASAVCISNSALKVQLNAQRISKTAANSFARSFRPLFVEHALEKDFDNKTEVVLFLQNKQNRKMPKTMQVNSIPTIKEIEASLGLKSITIKLQK